MMVNDEPSFSWVLHNEVELRLEFFTLQLYLIRHHLFLSPFEVFILPNVRAAKHPGAGYTTRDEAEKALEDIWAIRDIRDLPKCHPYKTDFAYQYFGGPDFSSIDVEDQTQFFVDSAGEERAIRVELWAPIEEFT